MDFLKKNWITIALIVSGLFLTWILFRGCAPDNTHKDEHKAVDSTAGYWQVKVKEVNKNYDYILSLNQKYETAITELATKVWAKQVLANANQQRINELVAQYKDSKVPKLVTCDSLVSVIEQQDLTIHGFSDLTDSIVSNHNRQMEVVMSQFKDLQTAFNSQSIALQTTTQKYDGLYKDYDKSVRANKFNKTLSRVLAGALLIVGGALVIGK